MQKVGIIGAGSWGTALAVTSSNAGRDVTLVGRDQDVINDINKKSQNSKYLQNITLPKGVKATCNIKEISSSDVVLLVIPAQFLRQTCKTLKLAEFSDKTPIVICCKGIEKESCNLMSEVAREILPENPIAFISGPNFAKEIANQLPAAATLACKDESLGMTLVENLGSNLFRLYYSNDITGAQIGGAVKNVLAIACGIAIGKGLGENARAALVTRGLAEISRLCTAKGGNIETLLGLSGIGDIMLTCGSETSRNMSFGLALGKGEKVENLIGNKITEGVETAYSVVKLAKKLEVKMPICEAIADIIYNNMDVNEAIDRLLNRPLTSEIISF